MARVKRPTTSNKTLIALADNIIRQSQRRLFFAYVCVAMAVVFGFYSIGVAPLAAAAHQLTSERHHYLQSMRQLTNDTTAMAWAPEALRLNRMQLNQLRKNLPASTRNGPLIAQIARVGIASGLVFTEFHPQKRIMDTYYELTPILVSGRGSYGHLAHFISALEHLKPDVVATRLKITAHHGLIRFSMIIETFSRTQSKEKPVS
ncbi:type 4a pilus biogenesis protein PilO [Acidithiobacillus ferrivorans]|nr:type 4a pilus biogenesis protein PilO [Acidithiobacillus ferrivorans]